MKAIFVIDGAEVVKEIPAALQSCMLDSKEYLRTGFSALDGKMVAVYKVKGGDANLIPQNNPGNS